MYEFLEDSFSEIGWRFFTAGRAGGFEQVAEVEPSTLPGDYIQFLNAYGAVELFRDLERGFYYLRLLPIPQVEKAKTVTLLRIGVYFSDPYTMKNVYLVFDESQRCFHKSVYEGYSWQFRKAAETFGEWLESRFRKLRARYSPEQWEWIKQGPPPFDEAELSIVESIPLYRWRLAGISGTQAQFEISNQSAQRLSRLTVRWRCKGLESHVGLDVSGVGTGSSSIIFSDFACYGRGFDPHHSEFFAVPPPQPDDRGIYFEFEDANRWKMPEKTRGRSTQDKEPSRKPPPLMKEIGKVDLKDLMKYPIWLQLEFTNDNDEGRLPAYGTEATLSPALGRSDVGFDLGDCLILLKGVQQGLFFCAVFEQSEARLTSLSVFIGSARVELAGVSSISFPLELVAVPRIYGEMNKRFIALDPHSAAMV